VSYLAGAVLVSDDRIFLLNYEGTDPYGGNPGGITLPAREHELRIVMDTKSFNLNYVTVENDIPAVHDAGARIEAEDFLTAQDNTAGNTGGAYPPGDVDIQPCLDAGGGYNVGWIAEGERLAYRVSVAAQNAGYYRLRARVASRYRTPKSFDIILDGQATDAPLAFTGLGDWQDWLDAESGRFHLAEGTHGLALVMPVSSFNLNYFELVPDGPLGISPSGQDRGGRLQRRRPGYGLFRHCPRQPGRRLS
jgi:hypothetical protein